MMETVLDEPRVGFLGLFGLVIILLFALTVGLVLSFSMAHAVEKHGDDALLIKQCYDNGNVLTKWRKPDGRILYACEMPERTCFGVIVAEGNPEDIVTCFPNKSKTLAKLFNYFRNAGAEQVW